MTWLTNQVTFVECNDRRHVGDPVHKIETSYAANLREEMKAAGWGYQHEGNYHTCPKCVQRNLGLN